MSLPFPGKCEHEPVFSWPVWASAAYPFLLVNANRFQGPGGTPLSISEVRLCPHKIVCGYSYLTLSWGEGAVGMVAQSCQRLTFKVSTSANNLSTLTFKVPTAANKLSTWTCKVPVFPNEETTLSSQLLTLTIGKTTITKLGPLLQLVVDAMCYCCYQGGWKRRSWLPTSKTWWVLSPLLQTIHTGWPGQQCLPNYHQLLSAVIRRWGEPGWSPDAFSKPDMRTPI